MVVIKQYTTTQINNLNQVTGRVLYDTSLNILKFNDSLSYNNIIVAKDPNNNLSSINNINTTGNLGINTTSPNKQVEINSLTGDCLRLTYNDNNGNASNYSDFFISSIGNLEITPSGGNSLINSILQITNSSESTSTTVGSTIISGGVGIAKRLNVGGNTLLSANTSSTTTTTGTLIVTGGLGVSENINMGGVLKAPELWTSGGGIRFTTSAGVNYIQSGNSDIQNSANDLFFGNWKNSTSASTRKFILKADGKVGIGNDAPGYLLDVSGDINLTGTLRFSGTAVTSSATELNYVDVTTIGTAQASKALVVDASRNLTNLNTLSLTELQVGSSGTQNLIRFYGTNGDTGGYHTVLSERVYGNTEQAELLIFKGNDLPSGANVGPDRIRLRAAEIIFQTYTSEEAYNSGANPPIGDNNSRLTIANNGTINIVSHNASSIGLQLGGVMITSSASEINYLDLTTGVGTAEGSKALVLDSSRNIVNINNLTLSKLYGIKTNSTNNTVDYPLTIRVNPITTSSNGLGTGIEYQSVNSSGTVYNAAYINYVSSNVTNTTETGYLDFKLINSGSMQSVATLDSLGVINCTSVVETSDIRVKENIEDSNTLESLDKILQIGIKKYNFISDISKQNHIGIIAQELKEIIPSIVKISPHDTYEDFHSISYSKLIPHLINCIKELYIEINKLKN